MTDIGRITQLTTENKDRTDFHGVQCAIVPESTIEEWRADRDRLRAQLAVAGIEAQILRDDVARLRAAMGEARSTLMELRGRLHAAGRRPEECWEMSLIDDTLATTRAEALK